MHSPRALALASTLVHAINNVCKLFWEPVRLLLASSFCYYETRCQTHKPPRHIHSHSPPKKAPSIFYLLAIPPPGRTNLQDPQYHCHQPGTSTGTSFRDENAESDRKFTEELMSEEGARRPPRTGHSEHRAGHPDFSDCTESRSAGESAQRCQRLNVLETLKKCVPTEPVKRDFLRFGPDIMPN